MATAIVGANLGFETQVYMGEVDIERQKMNVYRMELMGAEVIPVRSGSRTLKDAINEAMRDWANSFDHTHYLLGTAAGAHPFPTMVRDFQSVIGLEARRQIQEAEGRLPDSIVACVGGGSNAMGIFAPFLKDEARLIAVEAGGRGPGKNDRMADNGASLGYGSDGVLHGALTKTCRTLTARFWSRIPWLLDWIIPAWVRSWPFWLRGVACCRELPMIRRPCGDSGPSLSTGGHHPGT